MRLPILPIPVPSAAGVPAAAILMTVLGACGPAAIPDGITDPFEAQNRLVHEENRALDRALIGPAAEAYGAGVPAPLRRGIARFADNLDTPRMAINALLQGRIEDAVHSTLRFVVNTTIGLGGVLDPATPAGLERRDNDFGVTLHVWGLPEGNYVELPVIGPATERDVIGEIADLLLNPTGRLLSPPGKHVARLAGPLEKLGDRYTFRDSVESLLHGSADSYAQARSLYLQHRRHELRLLTGQSEDYLDPYAAEAEYFDPYEDTAR